MQVERQSDQQRRDINTCLHCHRPCDVNVLFCNECRVRFADPVKALPRSEAQTAITDASTAPQPIVTPHDENIEEYRTAPEVAAQPVAAAQQVPAGSSHGVYVNMVEQAIHRLNDAARRIAAVDQNDKRQQPHASRLSPFRDISADIQRHSTPLPKAVVDAGGIQTKRSEASSSDMPDLWPWLPDTDDIDNNNTWENYTDPLQARRFPNGVEVARIEAEDERRARAEGLIRAPIARKVTRNVQLRIAFVSLAILAILALTIDTTLVSVAFLHPHRPVVPAGGPPTLTITIKDVKDNKVAIGQVATLRLTHFSPTTSVYLTRDVAVPILLNSGFPVMRVDKNGNANASTLISKDWRPGFHNIEAEDIVTHYTANATLQIIGSGPSKPSHLIIKNLSLDMGADHQGAGTIKSFELSNDDNASGAITWAASSNSPWLLLTPNQGTFSDMQTISIAVERGIMVPKTYTGKITFSSNVGSPIVVTVEMTVTPLPPDAGAVLMVAPPVLSFVASDGTASSDSQVLTVTNAGRQPLAWSSANNQSVAQAGQTPFLGMSGMSPMSTNWLNTSVTSGTVDPGKTQSINVTVNSQNLLPGAYTDTLVFHSPDPKTINSTQSVSVSLTVQPQCSLTLSTGQLAFNVVANSTNASNQTINVSTTSNCSSTSAVQWQATSTHSWLSVTPANGVAKASTSSVVTVGVSTANMTPGVYNDTIMIVSKLGGNAQGSTTVNVVCTVQPPPPPGAPIMSAAPLTMNFASVQGQPLASGQTVLITNSGQSAMRWNTTITALASIWLAASPTGGVLNPGQTATVTLKATAVDMTPGNYVASVVLQGYDEKTGQIAAGGTPQSVSVTMLVSSACALVQPSSSALAFSSVLGTADPAPQVVTLTASGGCTWPMGWSASMNPAAPWLNLSALNGKFGLGSLSTPITVGVSMAGYAAGNYTTQVTITTQDGSNTQMQGSPQVFSITMTVLPPCQMQALPASLAFTVAENQTVPSQAFTINETGTCVRPVSWSTQIDSASANWLTLSSTSGSDTGGGVTVNVGVNAAALAPATYKGTITVSTVNGATIGNGTRTIPVTLTVTGYSLSGTVNICADATCATLIALPAASLLLTVPGGNPMSAVADANGVYSFSNLALGTYTISASGLNGASVHFVGSATVTITGNTSGANINMLAG